MDFTHFKALILDCDGVIVDSEPLSCGAWNVLMKERFGIEIDNNYDPILGATSKIASKYYLSKFNIPFTDILLDNLGEEKEQVYYRLAKGNLKTIPGIKQLIGRCKKLGWKIAVASSGNIEKVQFNLNQVSLENEFDALIYGDHVPKSKPAPDIFLKTIEKLKMQPSQCIIIEDSINGVIAGKTSGAFTIGITTTFSREDLIRADLVIDRFEELYI